MLPTTFTLLVQAVFLVLALAALVYWFFPGFVWRPGRAPTLGGFFVLLLELLALAIVYVIFVTVFLGRRRRTSKGRATLSGSVPDRMPAPPAVAPPSNPQSPGGASGGV